MSVLSILFFVVAVSAQQPKLSGLWKWRDTTNYKVTQTGNGLSVTVLRGNLGPYAGTITGPNSVNVAFGPKCCTGQVSKNGRKIIWSNKTNWTVSDLAVLQELHGTPTPTPTTTKNPNKTQPGGNKELYLIKIANRLAKTRAEILALSNRVQQELLAAANYARQQRRPDTVVSSILQSHSSVLGSLTKAHGSVSDVETKLRSLGVTPTPKPTTPKPTTSTPRPTPPQDPNDPSVQLQNWFHQTLNQAQQEAASDLNQIDSLINGISEGRKKSLQSGLELRDKRRDAERKAKLDRKAKRKEERTKRKDKEALERSQRRIAYEHFRKRNPSQADIEKLNKLRKEERRLRREKSKEERKKRRQAKKARRRERRKQQKQARQERKSKRQSGWRDSMNNITRDVELVAKKTIITLGHAIQGMQNSLGKARDELSKLSSSCRQADHLTVKYQQASNMTETMKSLATKTIDSLKIARNAIKVEEHRHQERVEKRDKEAEQREVRERVEGRNKRRARQRKAEAQRKQDRKEKEAGRKERETKRSEKKIKREREQKEKDVKRQQQLEKDHKDQEERKAKRESKRKAEEKTDQSSDLAVQIKKAIQGVVESTRINLQENLKDLKVSEADKKKHCDKAIKKIEKIGAQLTQSLSSPKPPVPTPQRVIV